MAEKKKKQVAKKTTTKKATTKKSNKINITIETNMGNIDLELYPDKAPITVENFMNYINSKFFDGLIFHRVIKNFMIQGGGFDEDFNHKDCNPPIQIESDNGLLNARGTIAMARTMEPHSATSQFFINLVDNDFLNFREKSYEGYGYAVFGKVTKGMEVVDEIGNMPTTFGGPFNSDVPRSLVQIKTISKK